jgi:hypothetical protein
MLWKDSILDEINQIRETHAQKFNYDMWAIYKDLKAKEMKSEWKKVSRFNNPNWPHNTSAERRVGRSEA